MRVCLLLLLLISWPGMEYQFFGWVGDGVAPLRGYRTHMDKQLTCPN